MEQSLGLRPIPSEDPFFFFEERYDFRTKIGISCRLRPASLNNFEVAYKSAEVGPPCLRLFNKHKKRFNG